MAKIYVRLKTLIWSILWKFKKFDSVDNLVKAHFTRWSDPAHQNREGLSMALNSLPVGRITIVETGTSAYGTDSSRLFDSFV